MEFLNESPGNNLRHFLNNRLQSVTGHLDRYRMTGNDDDIEAARQEAFEAARQVNEIAAWIDEQIGDGG